MTLTYTESTESPTDLDRRHDARVPQQRPVRVFEPMSGRSHSATTANISRGGLCLRLPTHVTLRPGARLLTLYGLPAAGPRLADPSRHATAARVVWVRVDPDHDGRLLVGVQLYASGVAAAA